MRFIDLFCGIGGFRLALEERGHECVFSSDIDKFARESYRTHFGECPYGDITQIAAEDIPEHDIITGGFPCQPFSISSRRRQLDTEHDERRDLFQEILRIVRHHKPKVALLENVTGLARGEFAWDYYRKVTDSFQQLGYAVDVSKLTASDFGIPQQRTRLYIVAYRADEGMFYSEPQPFYGAGAVVDILEDEVDERFYLSEDKIADVGGIFHEHWNTPAQPGRLTRIGHYKRNREGQRVYDAKGLAATLNTSSGDYYLMPDQRVRKLTPRERMRLMGFPEDYRIVVSNTQAFRQTGNAVHPKMIGLVHDGLTVGEAQRRLHEP